MHSGMTVYWFFTLLCMVVIYLDLLAAPYPIPFYSWRESKRYWIRSAVLLPDDAQPKPISYNLDTWSQYDNPEEGNAREGDIWNLRTNRKTTTTDRNRLWHNGVVRYFVDDAIVNEPAKLAVLEEAMETIMETTCVRFFRIYPDLNGRFPYHAWVNITGNEQGCFSDLGRSDSTPSRLNLAIERCFRTKGHAIHEILHTLGVFHEHMRPDRDDHIKILWDNIKVGDAFNFRIMDNSEVTTYGLPYDYDSIMHYSMTAFSKDKSLPTIVPRQRGAEIGQRNHLSFYDVQKLLIAYKCNDVDSEYLYHKMGHRYSDQIELLNLNASKSLPAVSITPMDASAVPADSLRDYRSSYTMAAYPTMTPIN